MITQAELLDPVIVKEIQQHARETYPQECIGAIMPEGYRRLVNHSEDKEQFASIPPMEVLVLKSEGLKALVHSHPDGPNYPSFLDMRSQISIAVPFVIVACYGDGCDAPFAWGDQLEPPPLMERVFRHGVTDCYEFVRDYYRPRKLLRPYPRGWGWWEAGQELYSAGFSKEGFRPVDYEDIQVGDAFLASIATKTGIINHAGIYVGDGQIVHQLTGKLPYDATRYPKYDLLGNYIPFIKMWVRLEECPTGNGQSTSTDASANSTGTPSS